MSTRHRFTIFDVLEQKGYFEANPANPQSRDKTDGRALYTGPVEYPKMLYHPTGQERVIVPAEVIQTPLGPKEVGEQRELVWQIVDSAAADAEAQAEGWWDHPSKAIRKRVELLIEANPHFSEKERAKLLKAIPVMSSDTRIRDLEAEIARLTASRDSERSQREAEQEVRAESVAKPLQPAAGNALFKAQANPVGNQKLATPAQL